MTKNFKEMEDVLADESFQAWYNRESEASVKEWENWLSENPHQQSLVADAVEFLGELKASEMPVSNLQTEAALQRLSASIQELQSESTPVIEMPKRRSKWWMAAAAAVLLLVAGAAFWKLADPVNNQDTVDTKYGEVTTHFLPDGSTMMLNAHSTAKLSDKWEGTHDREVWLRGEAFFRVKKTPQRNRFIVHTNQLDIIVTGTQFNVWTRDNKTSVLLTEGSVTIRTANGEETKMVPGDYVEINNSNLEKKKANEESVLAWRESKLIFDKTRMSDVSRLITEHYGIKVTITDPAIESKLISGFMPNDSLEVLLKALEATNEYKITRKENEILISQP